VKQLTTAVFVTFIVCSAANLRQARGAEITCPLTDVLRLGQCPPPPSGQPADATPTAVPPPADSAAQRLRALSQPGLFPQPLGASQSLDISAVNEAVQILGQIVVDRASAEAFRVLQDRLETSLACDGKGKDVLPATCAAIAAVRVQDLATAPQALRTALLQDFTRALFTTLTVPASTKTLIAFVSRDMAPLFARSANGLDSTAAGLAVAHLRADGAAVIGAGTTAGTPAPATCSPTDDTGKAKASLSFASAGLGACLIQTDYSLGACPITSVITKLIADACSAPVDAGVSDMAVKLGLELQNALTATTDKGKTDVGARLRAANDAIFDFACASVDFANECVLKEPDPNGNADPNGDLKSELSDLHAVYGAIISGDNLQIVIKTATLLKLALDKADPTLVEQHKRAFRLLGGVLDYTLTFDPTAVAASVQSSSAGTGGTTTAASLHEQRTKILESLTTDMTDRTGRIGDTIFSFGGALRVTAGKWLRKNGDGAFYGPLSLPLGVGLDVYSNTAARGFHFELSAVDLARYLSYQDGGKVNEVNVVDAFTPGASIAYFWGASLPFTLGVHGAFSPRYQFSDETTHAFSVAVEAGFYVPLIDLN
jgi:hypothetical protein